MDRCRRDVFVHARTRTQGEKAMKATRHILQERAGVGEQRGERDRQVDTVEKRADNTIEFTVHRAQDATYIKRGTQDLFVRG